MGTASSRWAPVAMAVILGLLLAACSSSDGGGATTGPSGGGGGAGSMSTSPAPSTSISPTESPSSADDGDDVSGTWSGTWQNTSPDDAAGTFEMTLAQEGSKTTGSIVVHGTPCLSAGEISGVVSNGEIQFGAVKAQSQIVFTGSLGEGDTMGGSYQASANCADATGSWEAEKTGA